MEITRPRLCPCAPPGMPQPQMRSSMSVRSSCGTWSSTLETTYAPRSSGRTSTSDPLRALPIGDRPRATITASVMGRLYANSDGGLAVFAHDHVDAQTEEDHTGDAECDSRIESRRGHEDNGQHQTRQVQRTEQLEAANVDPVPSTALEEQLAGQPLIRVKWMKDRVHAATFEAAQVAKRESHRLLFAGRLGAGLAAARAGRAFGFDV